MTTLFVLRRDALRCAQAGIAPSTRISGVPFRDESRALDEDAGSGAEWCQRLLGLGHQLAKSRLRAGDAEHAHHGGLAGLGVFAGRFADQRGVAFEIEEVVGDLEGLADRNAIAVERRTLAFWGRRQNSAGLA